MVWILPVNAPPPFPTLFSTLAGTLVVVAMTLDRAAPVGPFGPAVAAAGLLSP